MTTIKILKELKLSNEDIARIMKSIDLSTKSRPLIYDGPNIVAKFCTKHQAYELVEAFPKSVASKDGLYSHCRYAEKVGKAKAYSLQKLKAKIAELVMADDPDLDKISSLKEEYNNQKSVVVEYDQVADYPDEEYKKLVAFNKKFKKQLEEV